MRLLAFLAVSFFTIAPLGFTLESTTNQDSSRPDLVQEVKAGKLEEARVSWWGFDPKDSTEHLQNAINSKVKRLIIDRQSGPWFTRPLTGISNQEIIFESDAELVALQGAYQANGDCLLTFRDCENVVLRGEQSTPESPARIRMHKQDYQSDSYSKSEWRHGVSFHGCRNLLIQDLTIQETGGDGIYLGTGNNHAPNRNVTVRRVDCNDNHRQGISVISVEDLLIEDCRLRNTQGTAPAAGIDFEPNEPDDLLVRCVVRRCVAEGNDGTGFQICPQFMTGRSTPISIRLEQCVSRKNKQHAVHVIGNPESPPSGTIRITDLLSEKDAMAGLSIQFNPFDAIKVELENSTFRDCAIEERYFPPLYVQGLNEKGKPSGNLHIKNLTIKDDIDRSILRIRDQKRNGVQDISGTIKLQRNDLVTNISINEEWLNKAVD